MTSTWWERVRTRALDIGERVGRTFLTSLLGALMLHGYADLAADKVYLLAAAAAALSLLKNIAGQMLGTVHRSNLVTDVLERGGWTFIQSFLGYVTLNGHLNVASADLKAAVASTVPGVMSIVLGYLSSAVSKTPTAGLLAAPKTQVVAPVEYVPRHAGAPVVETPAPPGG